MDGAPVRFGDVEGDVIGGVVGGGGNIVGKEVTISGTINIDQQQLQSISNEYAKSLKDVERMINEQFQKHNVPKEKVDEIQKDIDEFTNEIKDIKGGGEEDVTTAKTKILNGKFSSFTEKIPKAVPKTAETIAAFTPLAPFSRLIGEGVEAVSKSYSEGSMIHE
ncbi:MAG: hypothetical protein ACM3X1_05790 [Ignavibacteriales bacterium]